jgi:hypothetical protein
VELNVNGTPLLIEYDDSQANVLGRIRQVEALLAGVTFPR